MSGLGRKVFAPNDILAAADVMGYLMDQSVMVFSNATERTTEVPTPTEGMVSYLADTDALQVYTTTWRDLVSSINASAVVNTLTASTATAYTFASSDQSKVLQFSNAGTGVVETSTALTSGQRIDVLADGATFVVTAGSGVTFAGAGTAGTAYEITQYDAATILCVSSNAYRIIGNVRAI
jgi:hypothetical protein